MILTMGIPVTLTDTVVEEGMAMNVETAVKTYQCPGCVDGPYPACYKKDPVGSIGRCFPLPWNANARYSVKPPFHAKKNFPNTGLYIFINAEKFHEECTPKNPSSALKTNGLYDNFNIPVWKYLDEHGNTLVRGLKPRINTPFLHVFLWDARDEIQCLELT
jgi:hypothetical protein